MAAIKYDIVKAGHGHIMQAAAAVQRAATASEACSLIISQYCAGDRVTRSTPTPGPHHCLASALPVSIREAGAPSITVLL
jgi:hypothetical protein